MFFATDGLLWTAQKPAARLHMHFLCNLNHDKKLLSEIDCSCRYIIFFNLMHLFGIECCT